MKGEIDFTKTVLICSGLGILVGLVGAIPVIRDLCCLWVVAGGFIAAYLATKEMETVELVEGVIVGALFGLVYGLSVNFSTFILNAILNFLGIGATVRGVVGGGIIARLGIELSIKALLMVVLNTIIGITLGAVGGLLYAATDERREKEDLTSGQKNAMPSQKNPPQTKGKTTLGRR